MKKYDVARRFAIYCDTDAKWTDGYSVGVPTTCFENAAHTVSTVKNPRLLVDTVDVMQHDTTEYGTSIMNHTKITTLPLQDDAQYAIDGSHVLKANTASSMVYISPAHPSALFGMHALSGPDQADDSIDLYVAKDTILGVLASPVAEDDHVIHVMNPPYNSIASVYTGYEIGLRTTTPEVSTITTTGAFATLTQGEYLVLYAALNAAGCYAWIDTAGDGTTGDPAPANLTGIAVNVSAAANDGDVALAFKTAIDASAYFSATVSGNVCTVTNASTGPATDVTSGVGNVAVAVALQGSASPIDWYDEVDDINTSLMKIRMHEAATKAYSAYTTVVYVQRRVVKNLRLGTHGGLHTFGQFQLGSMLFPPATPCYITYTSRHPEDCYQYVDLEWGEGTQDLGTITE